MTIGVNVACFLAGVLAGWVSLLVLACCMVAKQADQRPADKEDGDHGTT